MTLDEIVNKTREAIQKISDTNSSIWHTTEWNICHHLACELAEEFSDFNVDVELEKKDSRRPDIVIHKRGNNKSNLAVFQVKKNPTTSEIEEDMEKIRSTFFNDPYEYPYGVFISIGKLPEKLPDFDKNRIRIVKVYGWKIIQEDKRQKNKGNGHLFTKI